MNKEDREILCSSLGKDSLVGYILSLGVRRAYRRNGIASLLLEQLLAHVTAPERSSVKAVFLHVLSTNSPAIQFYQRCHFRLHSFLPYYYLIHGICRDGFMYVLYVNGGHAPWGLWDWMCHVAGSMASLGACRVPRWIWQRLLWASTLLSYHRWYVDNSLVFNYQSIVLHWTLKNALKKEKKTSACIQNVICVIMTLSFASKGVSAIYVLIFL